MQSELHCCYFVPPWRPPFCFWLFLSPCWTCLKHLQFLVRRSLCIRNFHCLRNYAVNCNATYMIFMSSFLVADSILGLEDSCATAIHTTEFRLFLRCLGFLCCSNGFPIAGCSRRSLAWHRRGHRRFQFPSRILNDVLVVFITRINRINFTQTSGILEFWLFECPFLFFFFQRLSQFLSTLQDTCDLDVSSSEFLSVSPGTT